MAVISEWPRIIAAKYPALKLSPPAPLSTNVLWLPNKIILRTYLVYTTLVGGFLLIVAFLRLTIALLMEPVLHRYALLQ